MTAIRSSKAIHISKTVRMFSTIFLDLLMGCYLDTIYVLFRVLTLECSSENNTECYSFHFYLVGNDYLVEYATTLVASFAKNLCAKNRLNIIMDLQFV